MLVKAGCPLVLREERHLCSYLGNLLIVCQSTLILSVPWNQHWRLSEIICRFRLHQSGTCGTQATGWCGYSQEPFQVFYQIAYRNDTDAQSYILLDVLYEDIHYFRTQQIAINCPFIRLEGKPLMVTVPSAEDILGDKLTAFAPNTTGIPYYRNGRSCSMEIAKQLYDVGRLFENVSACRLPKKRSVRLRWSNFHTGLSERT